jgi:hypothetical protein
MPGLRFYLHSGHALGSTLGDGAAVGAGVGFKPMTIDELRVWKLHRNPDDPWNGPDGPLMVDPPTPEGAVRFATQAEIDAKPEADKEQRFRIHRAKAETSLRESTFHRALIRFIVKGLNDVRSDVEGQLAAQGITVVLPRVTRLQAVTQFKAILDSLTKDPDT